VLLFQAVIDFVAVMTGLGFVFNFLLTPLKRDIAKLEKGLVKLEEALSRLSNKVDELLTKK